MKGVISVACNSRKGARSALSLEERQKLEEQVRQLGQAICSRAVLPQRGQSTVRQNATASSDEAAVPGEGSTATEH